MFNTTNLITGMHIHCTWGPSQDIRFLFSRSLKSMRMVNRVNGCAESAEIPSAFHLAFILIDSSMKPRNMKCGNTEPVSAFFHFPKWQWHKL